MVTSEARKAKVVLAASFAVAGLLASSLPVVAGATNNQLALVGVHVLGLMMALGWTAAFLITRPWHHISVSPKRSLFAVLLVSGVQPAGLWFVFGGARLLEAEAFGFGVLMSLASFVGATIVARALRLVCQVHVRRLSRAIVIWGALWWPTLWLVFSLFIPASAPAVAWMRGFKWDAFRFFVDIALWQVPIGILAALWIASLRVPKSTDTLPVG